MRTLQRASSSSICISRLLFTSTGAKKVKDLILGEQLTAKSLWENEPTKFSIDLPLPVGIESLGRAQSADAPAARAMHFNSCKKAKHDTEKFESSRSSMTKQRNMVMRESATQISGSSVSLKVKQNNENVRRLPAPNVLQHSCYQKKTRKSVTEQPNHSSSLTHVAELPSENTTVVLRAQSSALVTAETFHKKLAKGYSLSALLRPPVRKILQTKVAGKVKWFDNKKGIGYIIWSCGDQFNEDLLINYRNIAAPNSAHRKASLSEGESVTFDIAESSRGREAVNVTGPNGTEVEGSRLFEHPKLLFSEKSALEFFKVPNYPLSSTDPEFFKTESGSVDNS